MYQPSHEELLDLGFESEEWEGRIYGYSFESLSYTVGPVAPWKGNETNKDEKYPFWRLGSWYHPWYPQTKEDVMTVIARFSLITEEK